MIRPIQVPLLDLKKQYQNIKKEINWAIQSVLDSGFFILGDNVKHFEEEVASFIGVKFGIGVASGTDALELSLRALGVGDGDEVITIPFTFIATAEAISAVGAKPVFVDIDLDTYNIDSQKIKDKINKKTKAIIPVHLYGQPCQMDDLIKVAKEYNLKIIEDCAQAFGSEHKNKKVGSFGDCGAFSFFPAKNLGCYGDGGMVVTNNQEVLDRLRMLRAHGSSKKYVHKIYGRNSRLDELQAAILRVKLKYIVKWNNARRDIAASYKGKFSKFSEPDKIIVPKELSGARHVYGLYTIRLSQRDLLRDFLLEKEISTAIHYPVPLHLQETYRCLGYKKGDFPQSELASSQVISLPMYSELKEEQVKQVVDAISDFLGGEK